ncbi:MAG: hypothetical protein SVV67_01520 [Bacillota bacterium]|nr:hypothetical protein [Bacillota bacterium]
MANTAYLNSIIKDLTDVLWEEHGTGAKYRTTLVGVEYFVDKYADKLTKDDIGCTVTAVIDILKKEELISDATFEQEDFVLKVKFKSCVHLETEKQLLDSNIKIINCPCANIVMHFIDNLIGKYSELVNVDIDQDECTATICMMKSD